MKTNPLKETVIFARHMIFNPPLVWVGVASGELEIEYWTRRQKWALRPWWMHTFMTVEASCGCRKRLGLYRTIICAPHAFQSLNIGTEHLSFNDSLPQPIFDDWEDNAFPFEEIDIEEDEEL